MSQFKEVVLNDNGQWWLFRAMCCKALENIGLTSLELGAELWEFTESLDMSFDEIRVLPLESWGVLIEHDAAQLKKELVKQH